MDLVFKGRGTKVSAQTKQRIEKKLNHLARLNGRLQRVEIEVIQEANPRVDGGHRIEISAWGGRKTYRAHGTGSDLDAALERVTERLERQLTDDHGRRRARMLDGANRLKSGSQEPEQPDEEPEPELEG